MPGPPPKDPRLRQRRNRTSTASTLPATDSHVLTKAPPNLPIRGPNEFAWHPETQKFWTEVWASPMAAEFIEADVPGLTLLAQLVDKFNYGDMGLAAEIRLQRQCFGLTPLDRRRLQWEVEKVTDAQERSARRRSAQQAATPTGIRDPRRMLRAVK